MTDPLQTTGRSSSLPITKVPSARKLRRERWIALAVVLVPFAGFLAALIGFGSRLTVLDYGLFLAFYLWTAFGITVGFHRLLSHRSFEAHPALRAVLAVSGSMALQGPAIRWSADHRRHHQFSDQAGRPAQPPT